MEFVAYDRMVEQLVFISFIFFGALLATGITIVIAYLVVIYSRLKKREQMAYDSVTLQVLVPKDNEIKIDASEQMFSAFTSLKRSSGWFGFLDVCDSFAFEIISKNQEIIFLVTVPNKMVDFVEKTIYGYYPTADIRKVEEPNIFSVQGNVAYACLKTTKEAHMPLKTYKEIPSDTLSSITSSLSKMGENEGALIQVLIRGVDPAWKSKGKSYIASTKKKEADPKEAKFETGQKILDKIDEKVTKSGFEVVIRVVVSGKDKDSAEMHLENIINTFNQFNSDLNEFTKAGITFKSGFMLNCIYKFFPAFEPPWNKMSSVLSVDELASIFHFPNKTIETPNITWLKAKSAQVSADVPLTGGTHIGFGYYRGLRRPVNIHLRDRMRHVYIIGKTGVGKSELLKEMIKQDIAQGFGVCVIDPHGDLIDDTLRYIPPERAEDVIHFDPSDTQRPMSLNLLEVDSEAQKHFITGAVINLMYKLYDPQRTGIIGPRFEHAVRNAMLTVMSDEGATFIEIVRVMTDQKYLQEILPKVKDPIVRRYWTDQIAQTSDFHKSEVLDYIVSKFGRFVTNKMMRNIIGQSKSSFDFRNVMDEGKILLINLSKGKLGEENSNFLGLVIIPKILAAAMSRSNIPESERRDFFLYVDEFQNFATPDFSIILSEARKYHLGLTVANQFIGQMDEEVKNAVFGNVGTQICFRVGATDASFLVREFQPRFNENDLLNVERFHAYMKTIVNNETVDAFSVDLTKDMTAAKNDRNEKIAQAIIQLSRLKFGKPEELVEADINQRAKL